MEGCFWRPVWEYVFFPSNEKSASLGLRDWAFSRYFPAPAIILQQPVGELLFLSRQVVQIVTTQVPKPAWLGSYSPNLHCNHDCHLAHKLMIFGFDYMSAKLQKKYEENSPLPWPLETLCWWLWPRGLYRIFPLANDFSTTSVLFCVKALNSRVHNKALGSHSYVLLL